MKKIDNNWIKLTLVGIFGLINVTLLVISAIYFSRLTFDKNILPDFWIKYIWLCIMILSSCFLLGCIFVTANYVNKMVVKDDKESKW